VSNYCFLYTPFPDDLTADIIAYWGGVAEKIALKNKEGTAKNANEKLLETLIGHVGSNDKIYYTKNCVNF